MTFTAEDVVEQLTGAGVRLDRALTEADVKRIEKKYGFVFGPDQRSLLRQALPLGDAWLNWRHATAVNIRQRLQRPIETVITEVVTRGFWPHSWGPRPGGPGTAEKAAREHLALVPALIPVYAGRYLPAGPAPAGSPVFTLTAAAPTGPAPTVDGPVPPGITVYARDLWSFAVQQFGLDAAGTRDVPPASPHIPFWSDFAAGASSADL